MSGQISVRVHISEPEHDLGILVARGQILSHTFELRNPTDQPVKILETWASTPCCSSIESFDGSVPPGGAATLTVTFRPGQSLGQTRIPFGVRTDEPGQVVLGLSLTARVVPEIEIACIEGSGLTLEPGDVGTVVFEVRRAVSSESLTPDGFSVAVTPELLAIFDQDTPQIEAINEEWSIQTRWVRVELPATRPPGNHRGMLNVAWDDGLAGSHAVFWKVNAPIVVVPPGLNLERAGPSRQTILVHSSGPEFRILKIASTVPVEVIEASLPTVAASRHRLELLIDPGPDTPTSTRVIDLTLTTDHPRQPEVVVSALIRGDNQP
ncbi:hypothetical protein BH23PLA1_BH23PLA1_21890 [soil metagenome]